MRHFTLRPHIIVGDTEYHQLVVLALTGSGHSADANDNLFYELDRARVVPTAELPADVVRMGSFVTYRDDGGAVREVRLVYPQHVTGARTVSVLTPLGTALLGLRAGQSISYRPSWDAEARSLTALQVEDPRTAAGRAPDAHRAVPAG